MDAITDIFTNTVMGIGRNESSGHIVKKMDLIKDGTMLECAMAAATVLLIVVAHFVKNEWRMRQDFGDYIMHGYALLSFSAFVLMVTSFIHLYARAVVYLYDETGLNDLVFTWLLRITVACFGLIGLSLVIGNLHQIPSDGSESDSLRSIRLRLVVAMQTICMICMVCIGLMVVVYLPSTAISIILIIVNTYVFVDML